VLQERIKVDQLAPILFSFSHNGTRLAANAAEEIIVWDTVAGAVLSRTLRKKADMVTRQGRTGLTWWRWAQRRESWRTATLSPDGRLLAFMDDIEEGKIEVVDTVTGEQKKVLTPQRYRKHAPWHRRSRTYRKEVYLGNKVAFSLDGRFLIALARLRGDEEGPQVVVWDYETGQEYARIPGADFATPPTPKALMTARKASSPNSAGAEIDRWNLEGVREALADAGLLEMMSMPAEEQRAGHLRPYPFDRLQEGGRASAWLAGILPLAPLFLLPCLMFAVPYSGNKKSFRLVISFAIAGLAALFAFFPGLYYLWLFAGVVPLAWLSLGSLKTAISRRLPLSRAILLSHAAAGLLNVLAGVYFLATFLNTPGWTVAELLVEGLLVSCFVLVGVQAVEVVIRCYNAQVHGVPRRDEPEAPETFGEVILSITGKLARNYAFHIGLLLCLGVLAAKAVEWLRTGKWPGRESSIILLYGIIVCAYELFKKKSKPAASDTGAGEKSS
jgi:hypothetical protein